MNLLVLQKKELSVSIAKVCPVLDGVFLISCICGGQGGWGSPDLIPFSLSLFMSLKSRSVKQWPQIPQERPVYDSLPAHKMRARSYVTSTLRSCDTEVAQLELWIEGEAQKDIETNFVIKLGGGQCGLQLHLLMIPSLL